MAQAPDERAHLPDYGIGNDPRHVSKQAPATLVDPRRAFDVAVARNRADGQRITVRADVAQLADRVDVHDNGRTREAKPHGRDEALPACQHARVGAMLLQ